MLTRRAWPTSTGTTGATQRGAPPGAAGGARSGPGPHALLCPHRRGAVGAAGPGAPRRVGQEGMRPDRGPRRRPPRCPAEANPFEQFQDWVGGGGNEAVLRLLLWLFDKLVVELAGWLGGVVRRRHRRRPRARPRASPSSSPAP